ncbi:GatB/YqeY domain-containing protein [Paucihalobacter ruber]|uniref:GatB/YqeY domain-containing protein n=1 Tax=Paucihalobacter ruber TaxID=2567861 RepID=A0A506PFT3_9FLAO|nr:GatB/YqeY domain-containing protein [Paucihalobacter ruber]TPV31932.1 GatB/YqeY domain-containing protein [Paucihalobacter ruber]
MSLQEKVMDAMKSAMKDKDQTALAALRAIKSEILLAQTSGSDATMTDADEIKILSKLVKQRKDSAAIYAEQNRPDLAEPELAQAEVISKFLPEQLSEEEISNAIDAIISQTGASGMKDMGKVMGMASSQLAGKADGKTISMIVKGKLS